MGRTNFFRGILLGCIFFLGWHASAQPNHPFPAHISYQNVLKPTNQTQAQMDSYMQTLYDQWSAAYLVDACSSWPNTKYVLTGQDGGSLAGTVCVDEGLGYGMIITAYMAGYDPAAQTKFNALDSYRKHCPSNTAPGLTGWMGGTCSVITNSGNADVSGDGDEDQIYGLLLADKQWGSNGAVNYLAEAQAMIAAYKKYCVNSTTHVPFAGYYPGISSTYYRPSDYMIDHFRAFGQATNDTTFWNAVVAACYSSAINFQNAYSPSAGMITDFLNGASPSGTLYAGNSCRVPWRLGVDYLLHGDARAKTFLDKQNKFIISQSGGSPSNLGWNYQMNGTPVGSGPDNQLVGPFTVGAMTYSDQTWMNNLWTNFRSHGTGAQQGYYGGSLAMLTGLAVSGNWWSPTTVGGSSGVSVPSAPALTGLANGSTGASLTPSFTWNASSGATSYALQISTSSAFSTTVANQTGLTGTSYTSAALSAGTTYYWRVNAANSAGTSAWSGAWSFTTLSVPAAPALTGIANGSTGASLTPSLTWSASTGATSYALQISTSSAFSTTVANQTGLTGTSYTSAALSAGTTYYWRVNAANSAGTGAWSAAWSFTTLSVPAAPALTGLANGSTGASLTPSFTWNASSGATSYALQISTSSAFSTTVANQTGLTGTGYTSAALSAGTTYYWRVNAANSIGTSAWSVAWSFTTLSVPEAPTLLSVANGTTGVSLTPTLTWTAPAGAASCRIQVSMHANFDTMVVNQGGLTAASYTSTALAPGTTYYWWMNATNAAGTGAWSATWSFTTLAVPASPSLSTVTNGATGVAINPTLTWTGCASASSYNLQISKRPAFDTLIVNLIGLTATSYTAALANSATYYWRVDAANDAGCSGWCSAWSFTTVAASAPPKDTLPPVVSFTAPTSGSTVSGTVTMTATASDNNKVMGVQFALDGAALGAELTVSPYSCSWNTAAAANGSHTLTATARDSAGNKATASVSVTVSNIVVTSTDQWVYQETGLNSPWITTCWSATPTFNSADQKYAGSTSIKVVQNAWGALSVHRGAWGSNAHVVPSQYQSIEFAVYGGATGITMSVMMENDAKNTFPMVSCGAVAANAWKVLCITMKTVNPNNYNIDRVDIMERSGKTVTYYVDNIRFVGASATVAAMTIRQRESAMETGQGSTTPERFDLMQNYPNPFNPTTTIRYALTTEAKVTLTVYNLLGQRVASLVNTLQGSGYHEAAFTAVGLASGVYFYRLEAVSTADGTAMVQMKRMQVLK